MKTLTLRSSACLPVRRRKVQSVRCSCSQPPKSIARLVEVTAGRLAFGGLLGTSIIGNLTGTSMFQQYIAEAPYVWAFVAAVVGGTWAANPGGICHENAAKELQAGRSSMVAVALLAAFDLFFIQS